MTLPFQYGAVRLFRRARDAATLWRQT